MESRTRAPTETEVLGSELLRCHPDGLGSAGWDLWPEGARACVNRNRHVQSNAVCRSARESEADEGTCVRLQSRRARSATAVIGLMGTAVTCGLDRGGAAAGEPG